MTMFVTVGSTRFDQLIEKLLSDDSINQIIEFGFSRLIIQVGSSSYDKERFDQLREYCLNDLQIELYDYKPSISDDIKRADVVVGHAGAGTCLEVLRSNKRLLIVVNDNLMDNHQSELAQQLSSDKYAIETTIDKFNEKLALICDRKTKLNEFPPEQPEKFEEIFDEALKQVSSHL
jgi:beta-1,4-N-acetylglucosaminyltransferase